jgi:diguanylate cyclase (GGDEF)-like protein/PAS domain S-box-containing protein
VVADAVRPDAPSRRVALGAIPALGVVAGLCVVVVFSDVVRSVTSLRTEGVTGVVLVASGVALALALLDRSRRETDPRHVAAYRWLAAGASVLVTVQGAAYLVLSLAGVSATVVVLQACLVLGFPLHAMGFSRMPAPLAGTRHEHRLIAADGVVAWLCFTAIFVQVSSDEWGALRADPLGMLTLFVEAGALAGVVWGVARSRHQGLLPASQLLLWVAGSVLYLAVAITLNAVGDLVAAPAQTLLVFGVAASAWLVLAAAVRPADEVESDLEARQRELVARLAPLLPPLLVLGMLAYDLATGTDLESSAAALALVALAGIVGTTVLLRLLSERELERTMSSAVAQDLHAGTGQPWFQALVGESSDVVTVVDLGGMIVYQTPSVSRVLGFPPGAWLGHQVRELVDPSDHDDLARALAGAAKAPGSSRTVELRLLSRQRGPRHTETTVTAISGDRGPLSGFVLTTRDVTDRRSLREQLEAQAETDALTGRANLTAMRRQTSESLRVSEPGQVAVMTLDLDRFSRLNDSLGHAAGDELLALASEALVRCVRPWDLVARISGDGFAILVMGANVERSVSRIQERVRRALAGLLLGDGREITLTASVGYAVNDSGTESAEELLRNADLAMSRARSSVGVDCLRFQNHMHEALLARVQSEQEIRAAFARDELELHHQPVIELTTGRIVGVEALARWRHPYRGLVSAGDFVPVVEELGLGTQLGEWVVGQSVAALARVRAAYPDDPRFRVGINLSAHDLTPHMIGVIDRALAAHGMPAEGLLVEVTESAVAQDEREARSVLQELRGRGVQVAIDDFGTGYASLSVLAAFPVDFLKIDRSFVTAMGDSREGTALIAGVIGLSASLGLRVVAEGIETEQQRIALVELGCPAGQGWLFDAALPLDELMARLDAQHQQQTTDRPTPS